MSFGTSVGRAIGASAAYAAHATVVTAKATGRFGEDVVAGTKAGYSENAKRLAEARALAYGPRPGDAQGAKVHTRASADAGVVDVEAKVVA